MRALHVSSSCHADPARAAQELRARLAPEQPRLVLYFASSAYRPSGIAAAMEAAFGPATVVGCTTAGEIATGAMMKNSVVAMGLGADVVGDLAVAVVPGLRRGGDAAVAAALARLEAHYGCPLRALDPARHVGIVLFDGLAGAEERVMEKLGTSTDVLFVGGSAGDDLSFQATHVFVGGKALPDAALLLLLRVDRGFTVLKTQSFVSSEKRLVATRVREEDRTVLEFDGKPAAQAYAAALGVSPEELPGKFMSHPLGLMDGAEPFVRSPQQVTADGVKFYCAIREGMELEVLRSTDIVGETRRALREKSDELGGVAGIVNFNCILRSLELEKNGATGAYGALFEAVPTVGFSTYGEEYLGHINQTATMLMLR